MACTVRGSGAFALAIASACAFGRLTPKASAQAEATQKPLPAQKPLVRRSVDGALSIDWLRRDYLNILEPANLCQFVDMLPALTPEPLTSTEYSDPQLERERQFRPRF